MKDISFESQKRKYSSLLEEVGNPTATVDILGDISTPWSCNTSMLGSMPSLLTPWISSHVTAFDDLKLWGHKRRKTAHTPQVRVVLSFFAFVFTHCQTPPPISHSFESVIGWKFSVSPELVSLLFGWLTNLSPEPF